MNEDLSSLVKEENRKKKFLENPVLLLGLILLLMANLIFLDIQFIGKPEKPLLKQGPTPSSVKEQVKIPTGSPGPPYVANFCPRSCLEIIGQATKSAVVQSSSGKTGEAKEYFISLGDGSSKSDTWEDLVGVETYIDRSKYKNIKEVVFEAGLNIPNGNQIGYARLFNVSDKHPVWYSEISLEGGTPKLVVSSPINLDEGKKLYRVQLKTSLKFLVILTQARIKITLE